MSLRVGLQGIAEKEERGMQRQTTMARLAMFLTMVTLPLFSPIYFAATLFYQTCLVSGRLSVRARVVTFIALVFFAVAGIPWVNFLLYLNRPMRGSASMTPEPESRAPPTPLPSSQAPPTPAAPTPRDYGDDDTEMRVDGVAPVVGLYIFCAWGFVVAFRHFSIADSYEPEYDRASIRHLKSVRLDPPVRLPGDEGVDSNDFTGDRSGDITTAFELYRHLKGDNPPYVVGALFVSMLVASGTVAAARSIPRALNSNRSTDRLDGSAIDVLSTVFFTGMFIVFFTTLALVVVMYLHQIRLTSNLSRCLTDVETHSQRVAAAAAAAFAAAEAAEEALGSGQPGHGVGAGSQDNSRTSFGGGMDGNTAGGAFGFGGRRRSGNRLRPSPPTDQRREVGEDGPTKHHHTPTGGGDYSGSGNGNGVGGNSTDGLYSPANGGGDSGSDGDSDGGSDHGPRPAPAPVHASGFGETQSRRRIAQLDPTKMSHLRAWDEVRRVAAAEITSPSSVLNSFFAPTMAIMVMSLLANFIYLVLRLLFLSGKLGPFTLTLAVLAVVMLLYLLIIFFNANRAQTHFERHTELIAKIAYDVAWAADRRVRDSLSADWVGGSSSSSMGGGGAFGASGGVGGYGSANEKEELFSCVSAMATYMVANQPKPLILGIELGSVRYAAVYILLLSGNVLFFSLVLKFPNCVSVTAVTPTPGPFAGNGTA